MTRHFTEHSKQYIRSWIRNKYKTDPVFAKNIKESNFISRTRANLVRKTDIITLEVLAECYQTHILT